MSAYVVDRIHVDLIVRLAIAGPSDGEHHGQFGPFPLRWWLPMPGAPLGGRHQEVTRCDGIHGTGTACPRFPSDVGAVLFAENIRSVMHRYPATQDGAPVPGAGEEWREAYAYTDPGYTFTAAEASAALGGLRYQSCEHPEWEASEAATILRALERSVLAALPGVRDAPHTWTAQDVADRRGVTR